MDEVRQNLISTIRNVFDVQLNNRDIFVQTAEQYFEIDTTVNDLFFQNWQDIPHTALIEHRNKISWLKPEAFRFYVPAIIKTVVTYSYEVDTLHTSLLYFLSPPDSDKSYYENFIKRAHQFTLEEAEVIAQFFDVYFDLFPLDKWGISNEGIKKILDNQKYWSSRSSDD